MICYERPHYSEHDARKVACLISSDQLKLEDGG